MEEEANGKRKRRNARNRKGSERNELEDEYK